MVAQRVGVTRPGEIWGPMKPCVSLYDTRRQIVKKPELLDRAKGV
jgi:hypothetical protein